MDSGHVIIGAVAVLAVGGIATLRMQHLVTPPAPPPIPVTELETKSPERVHIANLFNPHDLSTDPNALLNRQLIPTHEVEAFLREKGRTPANLIAALAMSSDNRYIAELRGRQDSPLAQAFLFLLLSDGTAIQRLHELDPDNAYVDFYAMNVKMADSTIPPEELLSWLDRTAAKENYDSYRSEIERATVEGFYTITGDVRESWRYAGVGTARLAGEYANETASRLLISQIIEALRKEPDDEARDNHIRSALDLAEHMIESSPVIHESDPGFLLGHQVLDLIPPDDVLPIAGVSREEIEIIQQEALDRQKQRLEKFQSAFHAATPADLDAMFDVYRHADLEAARDFLIERKETTSTVAEPLPASLTGE